MASVGRLVPRYNKSPSSSERGFLFACGWKLVFRWFVICFLPDCRAFESTLRGFNIYNIRVGGIIYRQIFSRGREAVQNILSRETHVHPPHVVFSPHEYRQSVEDLYHLVVRPPVHSKFALYIGSFECSGSHEVIDHLFERSPAEEKLVLFLLDIFGYCPDLTNENRGYIVDGESEL